MREDEVEEVLSILVKKLPVELALDIMEMAMYVHHTIIGMREETAIAGSFESQVYLAATIPETKSDKGISKLVFNIRSRDQGGSSYPESHGTYKAGWSWLQVELWRNKSDQQMSKPMLAALAGKPNINGKSHNGKTIDQVYEDYTDESKDPDSFYCWHYYHGYSQRREEDADKYKVGTWILQRNVHAKPEFTDHQVVWDSRIDEPSVEKAPLQERDLRYRDEAKWDGIVRFWENGHAANGQFVRELKPGDEMRSATTHCYQNCWIFDRDPGTDALIAIDELIVGAWIPHMVGEVANISEFNELINQDKITAVDFYTTWCPPCKAFAPVFHKYAGEFLDVNFVKVDVERAVDVGKEYEITSVPTIKLFRGGEVIDGHDDLDAREFKVKLQALLSA
ncbi:Cytoplasmic thioredoxin isoenzyme 2 [Orbilia oligospora]|uniref:Cytoplasmic thioredoxin isoenzyme 2 n=1 Tax=Orbilia oligospora TaxID=2813651 RepID=A0A7C8UV62_ORBOL|nr:Cytoplasmic thioredoxin isoenzyme 2 [Orbilia oligospora]